MNYLKNLKPALMLLTTLLVATPFVASCGDTPHPNEHDYVDLGLPSGLLWATCNVGATHPEENGDYYAWGETKTYGEEDKSNLMNYNYSGTFVKTAYNWATYKYCEGSETSMTKYCILSKCGNVDSLTVLQNDDDVANVKWGGNWRIATDAEWTELREKCRWNWVVRNHVNGYEVVGPNGNSIFLPAAGARFSKGRLKEVGSYGYYWTSTISKSNSANAYSVRITQSLVDKGGIHRGYGRSVRPVCTSLE